MSDDEFETNFFGTALPELPNDVIPTKKPITIADQIAVDSNGKRRFHGAFTGGFSAGYWNTVGSQEGWKPKEFKSSRSEKASHVTQNANDFMDDEDVGEFGINPQRIQTTNDFTTTSRTAAENQQKDNPVLNLFLMPAKDRASVALLKRMGWRENKDGNVSKSRRVRQRKPDLKVYQCSMGPIGNAAAADDDLPQNVADELAADDSDDSIESVTFNPDDYEVLALVPKINRFGLGYRGLQSERDTATSSEADAKHVNLFAPFEVVDRKNQKKLSIRGQAFGVGAFEEDDDDIYALDDMSTYNFETTKRSGQQQQRSIAAPVKYHQTIEGFKPMETKSSGDAKRMYTVSMPRDFRPRNWLQRVSRFAPVVAPPSEPNDDGEAKRLGRHMLTPDQRGQMLGTHVAKVQPPPSAALPSVSNAKPAADILASFDKRFVSTKPEAPPENFTPGLLTSTAANETQQRLATLFSKNFVSATDVRTDDPTTTTPPVDAEPIAEQPAKKTANVVEYVVQMKRDISVWLPCPMLCQKMNIEDPSRGPASKVSSTPFSLLKHVNLSARSRRNEKEFTSGTTMLTDLSDTPNAYVPKPPTVAATLAQSTPSKDGGTSALVTDIVPPSNANADATIVKLPVKVPIRPKSELEQSICKAVDKHPAEKKDLFKAIFESSDDEDDNDDDDLVRNVPAQPDLNSSGRSAMSAHFPNVVENLNILRNTSPPRGIFSALPKLHQKPVDQQASSATEGTSRNLAPSSAVETTADVYGPTLPRLSTTAERSTTVATSSASAGRRKRSHHSSSSSSESDEWIAADSVDATGREHSSRRKHKKQKSKHKKSKSKKCKKQKKHKR